jgi:hypothetical protein
VKLGRKLSAPSVLAQHYDATTLARQVLYNVCCQRTGSHRHDCGEAAVREQPVRRRK